MESDDFIEDLVSADMVNFSLCELHSLSTAAGSLWDFSDPSTMDIVVTFTNAEAIYAHCRYIREGPAIGLTKRQMQKIKEARKKAHEYLFAEANDPNTPIERKIELVRLTSKA